MAFLAVLFLVLFAAGNHGTRVDKKYWSLRFQSIIQVKGHTICGR